MSHSVILSEPALKVRYKHAYEDMKMGEERAYWEEENKWEEEEEERRWYDQSIVYIY